MAALAESVRLEHFSLAGLPMPATIRLSAPLNDDELLAFSLRNRPLRIERNSMGELEIMTPIGGKGSRGESYIIRELDFWAEKNGGASFSSNGGFSLPDGSMHSADAAWVSDERWNALSDDQQASYPPLCPDFVVELRSLTDRRTTIEAKMEMWIANGAQLAWMIDPFAATVSIYRPGVAVEVLSRPEWVEADSVVSGFRLETSRLWAES
jgi:Uma2 family endonuclease